MTWQTQILAWQTDSVVTNERYKALAEKCHTPSEWTGISINSYTLLAWQKRKRAFVEGIFQSCGPAAVNSSYQVILLVVHLGRVSPHAVDRQQQVHEGEGCVEPQQICPEQKKTILYWPWCQIFVHTTNWLYKESGHRYVEDDLKLAIQTMNSLIFIELINQERTDSAP